MCLCDPSLLQLQVKCCRIVVISSTLCSLLEPLCLSDLGLHRQSALLNLYLPHIPGGFKIFLLLSKCKVEKTYKNQNGTRNRTSVSRRRGFESRYILIFIGFLNKRLHVSEVFNPLTSIDAIVRKLHKKSYMYRELLPKFIGSFYCVRDFITTK